jgi:hypothetical protein
MKLGDFLKIKVIMRTKFNLYRRKIMKKLKLLIWLFLACFITHPLVVFAQDKSEDPVTAKMAVKILLTALDKDKGTFLLLKHDGPHTILYAIYKTIVKEKDEEKYVEIDRISYGKIDITDSVGTLKGLTAFKNGNQTQLLLLYKSNSDSKNNKYYYRLSKLQYDIENEKKITYQSSMKLFVNDMMNDISSIVVRGAIGRDIDYSYTYEVMDLSKRQNKIYYLTGKYPDKPDKEVDVAKLISKNSKSFTADKEKGQECTLSINDDYIVATNVPFGETNGFVTHLWKRDDAVKNNFAPTSCNSPTEGFDAVNPWNDINSNNYIVIASTDADNNLIFFSGKFKSTSTPIIPAFEMQKLTEDNVGSGKLWNPQIAIDNQNNVVFAYRVDSKGGIRICYGNLDIVDKEKVIFKNIDVDFTIKDL